jgi:aminopeptidase N
LGTSHWIIGNIHHSGFYRVNYDLSNWNKLVEQLYENHSLIDPINRAQLIDDSFNLARAELLTFNVFLKIIEYLRNETNGMPFDMAFDGLYFIERMLAHNYTAHNAFKVYIFI